MFAIDLAGNEDSTPATFTWTIGEDTVEPETTIAPIADGPTTFTFGGTDNIDTQLSFQCRLDSTLESAFATCTSPKTYTGLAAGEHTFEVRAVDDQGNVDSTPAVENFVAPDTLAPNTQLSGTLPANPTTDRSASFAFAATDDVTAANDLTFQCRLDSGAPAPAFAACTSPQPYTNLADGTYLFEVRAIDAAGNVEGTPASHLWNVDGPPDTLIVRRSDVQTPYTNAIFRLSSTDAGSRYECALDTEPFSSCTSPVEFTGLAPGSHTLQARAIDPGNQADADPASYTWTVLGPPDTTVVMTDPVDPEINVDMQTEATRATFTFGSPNENVTFECALDGGLMVPCAGRRRATRASRPARTSSRSRPSTSRATAIRRPKPSAGRSATSRRRS